MNSVPRTGCRMRNPECSGSWLEALGFALALAAVVIGAARPVHAGRGDSIAPPAVADSFYICGWVSPPAESTNAARMDEIAGAGMNLLLPALEDSGRVEDNLKRLDLAAARGMKCIIWD